MIECAQCGKQNTIDGRFCRSCGVEFPQSLLAAGRESLESTLRDAHDLLGKGRFQEATLLAESAHESDPSSAAALSLLGECHERAGRYDLALEYFERAAALNPDSNLDKLKVQRLRKVIASQDLVEPTGSSSNRNALFAAIAAVVLVVSLGAAFAIGANTAGGAAKAPSTIEPITEAAKTDSRPFATGGPEMALKSDKEAVDVPEVKDGEGETAPPEEGSEPPVGESAAKTEPSPEAKTAVKSEPKPVVPKSPGTATETRPIAGAPKIELSVSSGTPKTTPAEAEPQDKDKDKDKEKDKPKTDPPKKEQKSDPGSGGGIIDIRPSTGKSGTGGGSSQSGENTVKVRDEGPKTLRHWLEVARSRMMLRDWAAAANAFENAIRAGADPGITNQRLGQCYQELGRKGDARAAYQRAIKSFEAQRKVAPERTERLNISIEACKQALRVLGG